MTKLAIKIALSTVIGGLFIIVSFSALNYQNLDRNYYIVAGLLTIYLCLFGLAIGQNFARPIKTMLDNVSNMKNGNMKGRMDVTTKDEVEEVAKTFNKVTRGFEETKTNLEASRNQAEIKFKTKAILSDQIIDALEEKIKNRSLDLEKAMKELEISKEQLRLKNVEIEGLKKQVMLLDAKNSKKKE